MRDDYTDTIGAHKNASDIARDLRLYARAGAKPDFAAKLLAAAQELDALAAAKHPSTTDD